LAQARVLTTYFTCLNNYSFVISRRCTDQMASAPVDKFSYVTLVTGSSRGLGLEFVKQIAFGPGASATPLFGFKTENGTATKELEIPAFFPSDSIVLATCRNPDSATELNKLAAQSNGRIRVVKLDVDSSSDISALASLVEAEYGRLDLLINNAGVAEHANLASATHDGLAHAFSVNAIAPVLLTSALLPVLTRTVAAAAAKGGFTPLKAEVAVHQDPTADSFIARADIAGLARAQLDAVAAGPPGPLSEAEHAALAKTPVRVAFVSSTLGCISTATSAYAPGYRASKAALDMFVRCFALEAPGIAVAALHPGWVATDMGGEAAPLRAPASIAGMLEVIKRMRADEVPIGVKSFDGQTWPF